MIADERSDLDTKLHDLATAKSVDSRGRSLGARAQVWADLPDIKDAMLSTGVRIGELLAITADDIDIDIDIDERTVLVAWHLIRVTGQGLVRRPLRKSNKSCLLLRIPAWSIPMWRRRRLASDTGHCSPPGTANGRTPAISYTASARHSTPAATTGSPAMCSARPSPQSLTRPDSPSERWPTNSATPRRRREALHRARRIANDHAAEALNRISTDPIT